MRYLLRHRLDYFLIWGNGMPHEEEILSAIRSADFLNILRIMRHRPKSIARFVRKVYSYDYAPFQHLRSKTRYLLKTDSCVELIFVRNEAPREISRGQGAFRHVECERIKNLKEEIRNRFNPRRNGKRTEEHVVHASDNESQVDRMLRVVGFKQGIGLLRNVPNPILSLPYYVPRFEAFAIRRVDSSQVYCNILRGTRESYWKEAVQIEETPHYACLTGDTGLYEEYLSTFLGGPLTGDYSIDRLMALSRELAYLKGPYATCYIAAREFRPGQYLILDGVHRASVLKFRGVNSFAVAVVK